MELFSFKKIKVSAFFLAFPVMVACSPILTIDPVQNPSAGQDIPVTVTIKPNKTGISSKVLKYTKLYPGSGNIQEESALTEIDDQRFTTTIPGQGYGRYKLDLVVKHNGGIYPAGSLTSVESINIFINPDFPAGCFTFDDNEAVDVWRVNGVYSGDQVLTSAAACSSALYNGSRSWPYPTAMGGSMAYGITPTCFTPSPPSLWELYFISPDISDDPDWQAITGVSFHINTSQDLQTRAIVTYSIDGGESVRVTSEFSEAPREAGWVDLATNVSIPTRAVVETIQIVVFGQGFGVRGGAEGIINVDAICPIK